MALVRNWLGWANCSSFYVSRKFSRNRKYANSLSFMENKQGFGMPQVQIYLSWASFRIGKVDEIKIFCLTDTGEDSKFIHRRKRPKVDTLFSSLFSDASERGVWLSAESKILASTLGRFRLYRLKILFGPPLVNFKGLFIITLIGFLNVNTFPYIDKSHFQTCRLKYSPYNWNKFTKFFSLKSLLFSKFNDQLRKLEYLKINLRKV